ncbi:maestro heat-like repeat-containing protein family member 1, partial [Empidonax traillii]|uniref:maestro heat-like repeat-containing protein family member 1 n=1 Tax=Empidonax traillii TaxID=164674 RepID=UPI000FFD0364
MMESRIKRLATTLMDATTDKEPLVQEQIYEALCVLGEAEPEEILHSCDEYLRQHDKLAYPHRVIILKAMETVVRNNIDLLDKSTAKVVIFLASSEMTKSKGWAELLRAGREGWVEILFLVELWEAPLGVGLGVPGCPSVSLQLRLAVVEALGPMSYLMPSEKLEEQLPKLIPGILGLYKKHTEAFYISKSLSQILEASVNIGSRSLDVQLDALLGTLHPQ